MQAGQRVRLISAPDREGVLTGKEQSGRRRRLQVDFSSSKEYVLEGNLEVVESDTDIYDLLDQGRYGRVANLRGAITHSRLTGRLADVIYSMEATNTEFLPYQFKPVLNFLESTSRGILIADEVGLGKTIEAGLIWTELRARFDATKLLVICPAMLRDKWKAELSHRFGIRAEICNAQQLEGILRDYRSGVRDEYAVICSFNGLRPPTNWKDESKDHRASARLARYFEENEASDSLFDCVVIDEAHYLRNPESQTHKLGMQIRQVSENVILLSATPIQLRSDDLFNLLKVIDEENFQFKTAFDEVLHANQPVLELAGQLRGESLSSVDFLTHVRQCLSHSLLKGNRQLQSLLDTPPSDEQLKNIEYTERLAARVERTNLLARTVTRSRKRYVQKNRVARKPKAITIEMSGIEHEFYETVTEEVRKYCNQFDLFEGFLLTTPQRQMCSSIPAALRAWQKKLDIMEDKELAFEFAGGDADLKRRVTIGPLVEKLASLTEGLASFEQLRAADSKYEELIRSLSNYWRSGSDRKVILFSYFRETLFYLQERLSEDGLEVKLLIGGMKENKQDVIDKFREPNGGKILLSSEVGSEGVDLQFSSLLINYDLPWNPMRVEQRIGRIDRIGQKEKAILIWNFFYGDTLDDRIYTRLFERLDIFRYALGDMEAVLGERIRSLTFELLTHKLTPEDENRRIIETQKAIAQDKRQQEELEEEAGQLAAHGDYVLNKIDAAKEMKRFIDGKSLWIYVSDFLQNNYPGCKLLRLNENPLTVEIDLSHAARADLAHFVERTKSSGTTRLARNTTGDAIACIFDNQVDFGRTDFEIINQYHPLTRFIAGKTNVDSYHGLVAAQVAMAGVGGVLRGVYIVSIRRWSTVGARSIEKLVYCGINLTSGEFLTDNNAERLISSCITDAVEWDGARVDLDSEKVISRFGEILDKLDDSFAEYCEEMEYENKDRVDYLVRTLTKHVNHQIEKINATNLELIRTGSEKQKRIIAANEGRIASLRKYMEANVAKYERQGTISSSPSDVITGVINVF